ncbi:MAG: GAF domain-containing protein [Planctomycetota bacterium]
METAGVNQQGFDALTGQVSQITAGPGDTTGKLQSICRLLKDSVPYYNWVGFYLVDKIHPQELVLGPFVGLPTEHTRIPFGKGICGQAAQRKEVFIAQDVAAETNYIACSTKVRSEMVVPVFKADQLVGELDIDSNTISAFSDRNREFLETVCRIVGPLF